MALTFPQSSSESMEQKIFVCPGPVMQSYYGILIRNHHYHNCICRVRGERWHRRNNSYKSVYHQQKYAWVLLIFIGKFLTFTDLSRWKHFCIKHKNKIYIMFSKFWKDKEFLDLVSLRVRPGSVGCGTTQSGCGTAQRVRQGSVGCCTAQ
jgi:hypothetical protein